ncbi:hypothetical protein GCM10007963_02050 [Lutibacter litoralis]|nr:hypothetical protein GCM10007963_02050 [Lutibacter litoralis]
MNFNNGILLCKSDLLPSLELYFLNSLIQVLNHRNRNNVPPLIIESIGNAANDFRIKITKCMQSKIITTTRDLLIYTNFNESLILQFKLRNFEHLKTIYQNTVIETIDISLSKSFIKNLKSHLYR